MSALYPEIEPSRSGHLDVGDGNTVYWEECGNPEGGAVVVLHGGPGSGCSEGMRRYFNPATYRIVLFEQRGCGRSTPHASDPTVDLSGNTTAHLVADIERLRAHLGIERWLVLGVSWGCTLALAYAEQFPDRVDGMVLIGVTTGRRAEIDWLYRDVASLVPEAWARFRAGAPEYERDGDLVDAYRRLLGSPDSAVRARAARDWTDWDWATASVDPHAALPARWSNPAFQLARARICTHYFHHDAWLDDGALLRNADALSAIPGVLINGRHDLQCVTGAQDLARVWPGSEVVLVDEAGHATSDPGMDAAIVAATDRFAAGA